MTQDQKRVSAWPLEIKLSKDKRLLTISFDDGAVYEMPAEYLRVSSPSAEVKGHTPAGRKTVSGKQDVAIKAIDPVGNYAIQIIFDDGHDTGFYDWAYLHTLGQEQTGRWAEYLKELEEKGLSRTPMFF
jgi:Uncharacterized protein conserved in bacteria